MKRVDITVEIVPNAAGRSDYVITSSSGYRATMERCDRDCCTDGHMASCARPVNREHMHDSGAGSGSVDNWLKHSAKFCHGWHDDRVAAFVESVRRTYGGFRSQVHAKPTAPTRWPAEKLADKLGMTVDEFRVELAKASA